MPCRARSAGRPFPCLAACVFATLAAGGRPTAAGAATYSVQYNFAGGTADGAVPDASLVRSGSTLYGMTNVGGRYGYGTIFSFDLTTGNESVVYSFGSHSNDGANPQASLILSGSTLYGMTTGGTGQATQNGTLFSYNLVTHTESVLHAFGGAPDGSRPNGSLVQVGSNLYGMTYSGGANGSVGGYGTIFSYNTATNTESVVYNFGSGNLDGAFPQFGALTASGSTLYGTTAYSNKGNNAGTVFAFNTAGGTMAVLHRFVSTPDGLNPQGSLLLSGSLLYGTTAFGGPDPYGNGTLFSIDPATGAETTLHAFLPADGWEPTGSVVRIGDTLYGMARGVSNNTVHHYGTIFAFDLDTRAYSVLHAFQGPEGGGTFGDSTLLAVGDTLYGLADGGGTKNKGVIFSITVPEPAAGASATLLAAAAVALEGRRRARSRVAGS